MTKSIKNRMYMKIAALIFLLLTAAAATFAKKVGNVDQPNDKAQETKAEPDTTIN